MLKVPDKANHVQVVFFNDDETPYPFVIDLLCSVFGKSDTDAAVFAATVADLTEALDDMLFTGGKLNVRLLCGAQGSQ